jgi:hypothetical protein
MHPITGFLLAAPSTLQTHEPFHLGVKMLTDPYEVPARCWRAVYSNDSKFNLSPRGSVYMDNTPPQWDGRLRIEGPGYEGPSEFSFKDHKGPLQDDRRPIARIGPVRLTEPGIHCLRVTDPDSGLTQLTNPIEVTGHPPAERLFWGDLHSQSILSDGLRGPEELYRFARDEAFLDIFAAADHVERLTDRQWDYFTAVTNDFNAPGRFATLVGQEWTSNTLGHRNVYYPGARGPIVRCNQPGTDTLEALYRIARKHHALVIPHHPANARMGCDWSLGHDPEVERLVEIYSIWGNSERPEAGGNPLPIRHHDGEMPGRHVVDALARGYRFGFVGSGDIHDGRPGDAMHPEHDVPANWKQLYRRQGYVGVWAPHLNRQAIFESLWNRRCYATTAVRLRLRFAVDGVFMGGETPLREALPVTVEAASEEPIARVTIVRGSADGVRDIETIEGGARLTVTWTGSDRPSSPCWYYARVEREDGAMAWSSPVWAVEGRSGGHQRAISRP